MRNEIANRFTTLMWLAYFLGVILSAFGLITSRSTFFYLGFLLFLPPAVYFKASQWLAEVTQWNENKEVSE